MALRITPDVVRAMTFRQARGFFDYWKNFPPENESICVLVQAYTTWRPQGPMTEEEAVAQHRKSLEDRWKAGALDPRQMLAVMGEKLTNNRSHPLANLESTGIGPWPPKL